MTSSILAFFFSLHDFEINERSFPAYDARGVTLFAISSTQRCVVLVDYDSLLYNILLKDLCCYRMRRKTAKFAKNDSRHIQSSEVGVSFNKMTNSNGARVVTGILLCEDPPPRARGTRNLPTMALKMYV
jgi:hypothetical protein